MPDYNNKVVFGEDVLMDISEDTVTPQTLLSGETAHDRSGAPITGTAVQGHVIKDSSGSSMTQRQNLKFVNASVTDDSENNQTIVNVGADASTYSTNDSASATINDTDYVPMSDANGNKKKSLWTTIIDKIKTALGIASSGDTYLKKDGTWGTPTDNTKVAKSGDTMTGSLTFSTTQGIKYTGTKATYPMIKFIDNASDAYGNGILIGGGGLTIIGGGESADTLASGKNGGEESLYLTNDGNVTVVTNLQNGTTDGKTFTFGSDGTFNSPSTIKQNGTAVSLSGHTHSYAGSDSAGGPANLVKGAYTGSGGQKNPNYFGVNKVGFLMMNTTVNGNSQYKDWLIMDCYSGSDVGGAVAIGVNRQALGAYIMRSEAARTSWSASAEIITSANIGSQTVANSAKLGGYSASTSATANTIAMRQGNGYLYATYYNASNGAENPASYTSYCVFKDSSGWFRMSTAANFLKWLNVYTITDTAEYIRINQTDPLVTAVNNRLPLSGGTLTGHLTVNRSDGTTSSDGTSFIILGNSTASGKAKNSYGVARFYSASTSYIQIRSQTTTSTRTLYLPTSGTAFATSASSSSRVKENIRDMTEEEARRILDIDVVKFDYKEEYEDGAVDQSGVIAEEVLEIIPEVVTVHPMYDETKAIDPASNPSPTVDYGKFAPYLIKMIQMQQEKIEALEQRIAALENR